MDEILKKKQKQKKAKNGTIIYRDAFIISSLKDCSEVGNIPV